VILFVARADFANVGYNFAKALNSVGTEAKAVALSNRPLRPPKEQAETVHPARLLHLVRGAKCVVFMHSKRPWGKMKIPAGKKIAVFHGGTNYRNNVALMNKYWNPLVDLTLVQMPHLMGLGAKNEHWVIPAVDTGRIQPVYKEDHEPLVIGHFPTGKSKGSDDVQEVVDSVVEAHGCTFRCAEEGKKGKKLLPWSKHLQRMAACDVVIDQIAQDFNGRKLGEWSVTTLEAAALGKITLASFNSAAQYRCEYGMYEMIPVDNALVLKYTLQALAKLGPEILRCKQQLTRGWVEDLHGLEATGNRLKKLLC